MEFEPGVRYVFSVCRSVVTLSEAKGLGRRGDPNGNSHGEILRSLRSLRMTNAENVPGVSPRVLLAGHSFALAFARKKMGRTWREGPARVAGIEYAKPAPRSEFLHPASSPRWCYPVRVCGSDWLRCTYPTLLLSRKFPRQIPRVNPQRPSGRLLPKDGSSFNGS